MRAIHAAVPPLSQSLKLYSEVDATSLSPCCAPCRLNGLGPTRVFFRKTPEGTPVPLRLELRAQTVEQKEPVSFPPSDLGVVTLYELHQNGCQTNTLRRWLH